MNAANNFESSIFVSIYYIIKGSVKSTGFSEDEHVLLFLNIVFLLEADGANKNYHIWHPTFN